MRDQREIANLHGQPAFRQEAAGNEEQFKQCPEKKNFLRGLENFAAGSGCMSQR